ncbi:MAG: hypothetical protein RMY34_14700 [Aulosira sp. DedQUE10]|nr:hypothetical protein [Aulosira sp. DedQUE10]
MVRDWGLGTGMMVEMRKQGRLLDVITEPVSCTALAAIAFRCRVLGEDDIRCVGWVERSETQHLQAFEALGYPVGSPLGVLARVAALRLRPSSQATSVAISLVENPVLVIANEAK